MSQVAAAVQRIIAPISEDLLAVDREVIDDLQSDIPLIKKISDYIVTAGGKRMRPIVLMLIARALGYQGKEHIFLATMIEYVHTASLLHDDVVDESDLRRGKPTAGFKWGNAAAILTGDFMYSRAFQLMVRTQNLRICEIVAGAVNRVSEGEVIQLLILIISSCLTEIIGIHALFGAFMAGVVMPSNLGFRKVMMEKVEDISLVFFLPLFFAFTGLRTEIGLINSPELWMVCLLLVTVAVVGKLGGCAIAARLVGESWKDSLTIGTLMNTRGLMELVALNIGYEMGVLPPSIFVILVIMALVTTFMTTPLLHLVEHIFVRREEKLSLKHKLIFCFGRPESGRVLLSIYDLLFGKHLKKNHLIAAHYTVGTDLNPLNAEHYASESFALLNQQAAKLNIQVDNHYRVTDKLVQEIIHFVRNEHPDMLLLGAGSHYRSDMPGTPGAILWLTLFRDKIDEIMEQVKCPVAVFVNRQYREGTTVSFVFGGMIDLFLFSYLDKMLQNGHSVRLFLFDTDDEEFRGRIDDLQVRYPEQTMIVWFAGVEDLVTEEKDGLLIMSHLSYTKLSEDEAVMRELSSLLVIRRNKNTGDKNEGLEN